MAETNCDICLTDETLTFVNIANTTTTSKKFKIEAIGHDRIYACLDSDPSATFVNNVYSTCLAPYPSECFGATNYVILKNFESFYKENNMSYYIDFEINGVGSEIDPCLNIIDQINLNYIDIVEAKYQLDESNQPNNISLRNLTDEVLKIVVERGEEVDCNCPGATNVAILKADSDYVIYSAISSVEINGVVYQRNHESEQGFDSLPVGVEISHIRTPDYNYIIQFINNTPEFLKFKVNNYTMGYYEIEQNNQTLNYVKQGEEEPGEEYSAEYGYVTFCLAPPIDISCEGATDSCELKNDSDGMAFMSIDEIVVNGISYTRSNSGWGADFIFPANTIGIIQDRREYWDGEDLYWDYYIEINNLSDEFMRVEFIGYNRPDVGTGNNNPTLHVDTEALKATVCLSPRLLKQT